jgi:three-Cys-motif partner protein
MRLPSPHENRFPGPPPRVSDRTRRRAASGHPAARRDLHRSFLRAQPCAHPRNRCALIDGSAIAAATMAAKGSAPFSAIYVADAAPGYADATQKRLAARGITATALTGEAEHTARAIVRRLDKKALHFAFLDPFKLDPLPFTVLEEFAKRAHVDILINFATADLQRICGSMPASGRDRWIASRPDGVRRSI